MALKAVLTKWTGNDPYDSIVSALTQVGGPLEVGVRVFNDQAIDKIAGAQSAHDLFFADVDADAHGKSGDSVTGNRNDLIVMVPQ